MIIVLDGLDQIDAGSCLAFIFGEYYNFMLHFLLLLSLPGVNKNKDDMSESQNSVTLLCFLSGGEVVSYCVCGVHKIFSLGRMTQD